MDWNITGISEQIGLDNVAKTFGFDIKGIILFIIGSLIIGLMSLTIYYVILKKNEKWIKLDYLEKFILSFVVGVLSVIGSNYFVTSLFFLIDKSFFQTNTYIQLLYLTPFLYFAIFYKITLKKNYKNFEFISAFIYVSFMIIFLLNFILLVIISFNQKNYYASILFILLGLLIIWVGHKTKEELLNA